MNKYLREILEVNGITLKSLRSITGTRISPKKRENGNSREKFIFSLVRADLKIPYYIRPKCVKCGVHFIPRLWHQERCSQCRRSATDHIELTPSDCFELGMSFEEANVYIHLPESYKEQYEAGTLLD